MRWMADEIADVVGGELTHGDRMAMIDAVTQDSREIDPANPALFVPLLAERDGHEFIATSGAIATLSSRSIADLDAFAASNQGSDLPVDLAVIEVDDTAAALTELGSASRARLGAAADDLVVVGITGSVGKTTTKDLLAAILRLDRATHASHRSFNNEIGVPLTIANAPDDTAALVLEMGARGIGHIATLCAVGRPTVGIVTTVGAAHTSEFGSIESVGVAKGELVEALPAAADGGVAVLNAANPYVRAMAERTSARVVWFDPVAATAPTPEDGSRGDARVSAVSVTLDDELVPRFTLVSPWGRADVVLGARGLHLVDNALAAAAAALAVGVPIETVAAGLATPVLSPMRMELRTSERGTRILDDSYNANPMSTEAALRSLAALPAARRVAVLGEMAELGDIAAAEHARLGRLAADLGIAVIAVGAPDYLAEIADPAESAVSAAPTEAGAPPFDHALAADIPEALQLLAAPAVGAPIGADDAVLVKGSRVAGLERLAAVLAG